MDSFSMENSGVMSSDDSQPESQDDGAAPPMPALFQQGRVGAQHNASRVPVLSMSRRSGRPQASEEKHESTAVQGPWLSLAKDGM